jgi:diguanylate cyclase (GGDEF)-like protein/PAS domain S-box-containing protein
MQEKDLNKERLELALEAAGLDLWENNLRTGEVVRAAFKTFVELGYTQDEVPHLVQNSLDIVHPDDREMIHTALADVVSGRTREYRCEFRLPTKAGEWVWYANYGRVMDTGASQPGERFIGVTFNIDGRKRKEREMARINAQLEEQNQLLHEFNGALRQLASTDPLTGIANRRTLMELGEKECRRAQRFAHPLSILMIDIDSFKRINDRWGHQMGDRVICATADICRLHSRNGVDVVARLGGEEFVILLPETGEASAVVIAEKLRNLVMAERVTADEGELVRFTVSIGVAAREESMSIESLLHRSDQALYQAKSHGRNRVQRFEASRSEGHHDLSPPG